MHLGTYLIRTGVGSQSTKHPLLFYYLNYEHGKKKIMNMEKDCVYVTSQNAKHIKQVPSQYPVSVALSA